MLRLTPDAEIPYIYKRLDVELNKPIEEKKLSNNNSCTNARRSEKIEKINDTNVEKNLNLQKTIFN